MLAQPFYVDNYDYERFQDICIVEKNLITSIDNVVQLLNTWNVANINIQMTVPRELLPNNPVMCELLQCSDDALSQFYSPQSLYSYRNGKFSEKYFLDIAPANLHLALWN